MALTGAEEADFDIIIKKYTQEFENKQLNQFPFYKE